MKPNHSPIVSFRLDPETLADLDSIAAARGTTRSVVILAALTNYANARKPAVQSKGKSEQSKGKPK